MSTDFERPPEWFRWAILAGWVASTIALGAIASALQALSAGS